MNSKLPYILSVCTIGCISLFSSEAVAQDGYPLHSFQEPSYQELNLMEDKPLIYELNEGRSVRTTQNIQRDTTTISAPRAKAQKKVVPEKKEEDALSFNFLYYIIQKYKTSDIVDQQ